MTRDDKPVILADSSSSKEATGTPLDLEQNEKHRREPRHIHRKTLRRAKSEKRR